LSPTACSYTSGSHPADRSLALPVTPCTPARVRAQLGHGAVRATAVTERHQDAAFFCPVPSSAQGQTKLALDVVAYNNGATPAYLGAVLAVDLPERPEPADPLEDVRTLAAALPESLAVRNPPSLLRVLFGLANREADHLVRLAAGAPELTPLAVALAGEFGDALVRSTGSARSWTRCLTGMRPGSQLARPRRCCGHSSLPRTSGR
jgi:hypothetical protein